MILESVYYFGQMFDCIVMDNEAFADAYMADNPGWYVLWIDDDGRVFLTERLK